MGMWVNEGTPTMSFVLYTIYVEYLFDAWKYRQYRRYMYHVIFVRTYKTFQKINIPGARFNSSGTSFFGQCHHINGTCLEGCVSGFIGSTCTQRMYIFRFFFNLIVFNFHLSVLPHRWFACLSRT